MFFVRIESKWCGKTWMGVFQLYKMRKEGKINRVIQINKKTMNITFQV